MTDFPTLAVRIATLSDADAIYALIKTYPDELIVRPLNNIVENIDRFSVAELEGTIVACTCWQILPEIGDPQGATVELQSVAVRNDLRGHSVGTRLIEFVLRRVKAFRPAQALVLTFEPAFFGKFGFKKVSKQQIIHKIYRGCIYCTKHTDPFTCPEIAMILDLREQNG